MKSSQRLEILDVLEALNELCILKNKCKRLQGEESVERLPYCMENIETITTLEFKLKCIKPIIVEIIETSLKSNGYGNLEEYIQDADKLTGTGIKHLSQAIEYCTNKECNNYISELEKAIKALEGLKSKANGIVLKNEYHLNL